MGSKKNKVKKILAPSTPPNTTNTVDDDLVDDLFAELDSRDKTVQQRQQEPASTSASAVVAVQAAAATALDKMGSKNRFKARQRSPNSNQRQDADADAKLEREAKEEERAINKICNELGLDMHEINPDGHCLFSAVADQLAILNLLPPQEAHYVSTRSAGRSIHASAPGGLCAGGEDDSSGVIGPREYARYCETIRNTGAWGGEPEILALSRAYAVTIHVVQGGQPPVVVHDPSGTPRTDNLKEQRAVRISYHRRMYGLGEHYNSLRPRTGIHRITSPLKNLLGPS
ncbi:hypothetical protein H4582DRAFT_2107957 [Lactarius indigo]|nr:hypothetical protein H4582DRAFT_2107957 [Lactarius indigo]